MARASFIWHVPPSHVSLNTAGARAALRRHRPLPQGAPQPAHLPRAALHVRARLGRRARARLRRRARQIREVDVPFTA
eukprot:1309232-Prymnesium_polylepis.1